MVKKYCFNENEHSGYEPCAILLQHYNDEKFRTSVLTKFEFEHLKPWELCDLLNRAYENGRKDAMEDLRRFIGVKE